jgi:PTH1 family peptidyl-tRNA hydrolase
VIKLIVGLANPGAEYANTRHNAGAWLVSTLADQHEATLKVEKKLKAEIAQITLEGQACRLMVPTTYMNLSGLPLAAVANFYQLSPEEILVVHDELDLPAGVARLKFSGGHGGHNGLRDIFEKLGSQEFYRIRIGIGKPTDNRATIDYVLHAPSKSERVLIDQSIEKAIGILPLLMADQVSEAMKALNTVIGENNGV